MKRDFLLDTQFFDMKGTSVTIIGDVKNNERPYVAFHKPDGETIGWIKDKDIERFAVNILKALNSKYIKP